MMWYYIKAASMSFWFILSNMCYRFNLDECEVLNDLLCAMLVCPLFFKRTALRVYILP